MLQIVSPRSRGQTFLLISRPQLCQMSGEGLKVMALEARRVSIPAIPVAEHAQDVSPRFRPVGEKSLHFRPESLPLRDDGYRRRRVKGGPTRFLFLQGHLEIITDALERAAPVLQLTEVIGARRPVGFNLRSPTPSLPHDWNVSMLSANS